VPRTASAFAEAGFEQARVPQRLAPGSYPQVAWIRHGHDVAGGDAAMSSGWKPAGPPPIPGEVGMGGWARPVPVRCGA
jgi:hypothetical protein